MTSHDEERNIVTAEVLLSGFEKTYDRFMAEGRLAIDPAEAYLPIFEALNWAAAIDERLATDSADDRPNRTGPGERKSTMVRSSPASDSQDTVPITNGPRCST